VMFLVVRLQIAHIPSLIPYTTLFRSLEGTGDGARINASTVSGDIRLGKARGELEVASVSGNVYISDSAFTRIEAANTSGDIDMRSEEHTSELQSRENLVCRLLLEKKS